MINCEHVIIQSVVPLFFQVAFQQIIPTDCTKIVEITHAIYQRLNRRLREENVGGKVNNGYSCLSMYSLPLPVSKNLAKDPIKKPAPR